jgi:hypothetical protein
MRARCAPMRDGDRAPGCRSAQLPWRLAASTAGRDVLAGNYAAGGILSTCPG